MRASSAAGLLGRNNAAARGGKGGKGRLKQQGLLAFMRPAAKPGSRQPQPRLSEPKPKANARAAAPQAYVVSARRRRHRRRRGCRGAPRARPLPLCGRSHAAYMPTCLPAACLLPACLVDAPQNAALRSARTCACVAALLPTHTHTSSQRGRTPPRTCLSHTSCRQ